MKRKVHNCSQVAGRECCFRAICSSFFNVSVAQNSVIVFCY